MHQAEAGTALRLAAPFQQDALGLFRVAGYVGEVAEPLQGVDFGDPVSPLRRLA
ncbi:hypothetical protein [Streptomyces hypolithicus]